MKPVPAEKKLSETENRGSQGKALTATTTCTHWLYPEHCQHSRRPQLLTVMASSRILETAPCHHSFGGEGCFDQHEAVDGLCVAYVFGEEYSQGCCPVPTVCT